MRAVEFDAKSLQAVLRNISSAGKIVSMDLSGSVGRCLTAAVSDQRNLITDVDGDGQLEIVVYSAGGETSLIEILQPRLR